MKKLFAGAALALALGALPCRAQEDSAATLPEPQATAAASTGQEDAATRAAAPLAGQEDAAARAERAAREAQYWALETARASQRDPRSLVRQEAAFKRANRIERLEARRWTHRSTSRPVVPIVGLGWEREFVSSFPWVNRPWQGGNLYGAGVWGGPILGHGVYGYAESSRAPALGLFGGQNRAFAGSSR